MARKQLSKRTRFEIFKRDGFRCQYCGAIPPDTILHIDHIVPVADGGTNDPSNLVTSCASCNLGKGAVALSSVPLSLEQQAMDAAECMAQAEAYAAMLQEERDAFEQWCWNVAEVIQPGASDGYSSANFRSIKMFVRRLGYGEAMDAAMIASDRWHTGERRFKYFCGVCWRKIRDAEGEE